MAPPKNAAPQSPPVDPAGTTASPPSITGVILARNEEHHIADAIRSLVGWTEQILVLDDGSTDGTAALARSLGAEVHAVEREPGACFDGLRNLAIPLARGEWVYFLDADERVPPALAAIIREWIRTEGQEFAALVLPFRNSFCGRWMEHSGWWPSYCRPQLLRKGCFQVNERFHSGVTVYGAQRYFGPPDRDLAVQHYSYHDLQHYVQKMNRYTDGEAEALVADGKGHSWQAQIAHFVHDWHDYYDRGSGHQDGMHGFVLAFMSAFYRYASRAKAWDLRRQRGELSGPEPVPPDLRTVLEFMAHVLEHGAEPWLSLPHAPKTPAATAQETAPAIPALVWKAPLLDPSGYADEARQFVLGLAEAGEPCALAPEAWGEADAGASEAFRALIAERSVAPDTPCEVFVSHTLIPLLQPNPHARVNVARCMFETDRLPPGWEQRLNAFDAVWVPSEFNRETFVRSGVAPDKLAVVPGCVDTELFAPAAAAGPAGASLPFDPCEERFRFLSVFDWTLHKGWDVLLEAFAREFGEDPQVELWIKTWSSNHHTLEDIRAQADAHLRCRLGKGLEAFPSLHLWQQTLPAADLPRLYQAVDAFVLPTRGEGWCRPLMEAMACGLPTLATAWSGLTAFHNARVGYPIPARLVPVPEAGAAETPIYRGHCWAEPDLAALRKRMRRLVTKPEEAKRRGEAARKHVLKHYSRPVVTAVLREALARCRAIPGPSASARVLPPAASPSPPLRPIPAAAPYPRDTADGVDFRALLGRPLRVVVEGDQSPLSSLALVNREFSLRLLAADDIELSLHEQPLPPWPTLTGVGDARLAALSARRGAALSGPPDVTIRHHFPPNWERPASGKLVVMQPWEYGHLPDSWVAGAAQADEVWAYSRSVRAVYARSGVPAERVRVVPLGFDPAAFTPEGEVMPWERLLRPESRLGKERLEASTIFLFVGGVLARKGADLLLAAYRQAFGPDDPVCLIVKGMGAATFYRGEPLQAAFRQAQADPGGPPFIYLEDDLSPRDLASLYRRAHCLCHPYRGEGFALPPLEAMACGVVPLVTAGGPTDDFTSEATAVRIPAYRREAGARRVGLPDERGFDCVGDPWQLEPDFGALVAALRCVQARPEAAREMGRAAHAAVAERWTWDRAVLDLRQALRDVIAAPPAARPSAPPALWHDSVLASPSARRKGRTRPRRDSDGVTVNAPRRAAAALPDTLLEGISLCIIARDEAPRLGDCLESARPWVEEIVVVDTGSTDGTREVAREHGARVYERPWDDDFAAARNASLALARHRWILWVDADDVIPPETGRRLRELAGAHPRCDVAFAVSVLVPPGPGRTSEHLVDHIKLFPNRPDLRFEHRLHEQIIPALRAAGVEILPSGVHVIHRNYDWSPAGQEKKRRRDARILRLELQERPGHPFVLFNCGMTALEATGEFEVASQYLRRSLAVSSPQDSIVPKSFAMLHKARFNLGDLEGALDENERGRAFHPDDAELLLLAGEAYQQIGRWDAARLCLERLVDGRDPPGYRSADTDLRTQRGPHALALLYRALGDASHCEAELTRLLAAHPDYLPAREDLAATLHALARGKEAAAVQVRRVPLPAGPESGARSRSHRRPSRPG